MTAEQWRAVVGYEGFYEVSDRLRVRSVARTVLRADGVECRWRGRILKHATRCGTARRWSCGRWRCLIRVGSGGITFTRWRARRSATSRWELAGGPGFK